MIDDLFDVLAAGTPEEHIVLRLHVQPGAGRTAVVGRHGDAVKVKVGAPPEGGRANAACIALVAHSLGVAERDVEVTSGGSSRNKRVRVSGLTADEMRRRLQIALDSGNAGSSGGVRPAGPLA